MSRTAVVICPGRGTYNKAELGYLARHHARRAELRDFDAHREQQGQQAVTTLDGAPRFSSARHTTGEAASPLIYAASYLDATAIAEQFEVVAVTGNSMGWYTALAVSGAVTPLDGFAVANTMGTLMHQHLIGGQTLYPFVDDDWRAVSDKRADLLTLVADIAQRPEHLLAPSIHLGGMLVVAGNSDGLEAFEAAVPPTGGRYPMRLPNHAAFHTALQSPVAAAGRDRLAPSLIHPPTIPLIDGRGAIWWSGAVDPLDLYTYTLDHQVTQPYDFTRAIQVAARAFAPEVFVITGPGTTLGGAVAQSLIAAHWQGLDGKAAFQARQAEDPLILSMGRADQRDVVTR